MRAVINLGNPVLASGTTAEPRGVSVELARVIADELGDELELVCVDAARDALQALLDDRVDVAFLADDPSRADRIAFTSPYLLIDGVFVVPADSPIRSVADVDRDGIRVGVKRGSAYDLHLTRTLTRAEVVRGEGDGVDVYLTESLDAGAGLRGPVNRVAATRPGHRVIDEPFMQIRQAVAVSRGQPGVVVATIEAIVERCVRDGSIARWLQESGQQGARVAPPRT